MNPEDKLAEQYFHECFGIVADAAIAQRQGGEMSLWLRLAQKKLLENLRKLIAESRALGPVRALTEEVKPKLASGTNGHAPTPAKRA